METGSSLPTKTKYMINRHDENKIKVIELMGKKYGKVEFLNIWDQ